VERVESFQELSDEWRHLCEAANGGIFSTWEWSAAWWRAFGEGHELALHAVRDAEGGLVAILPLCLQRRAGLRIVRLVGHGPGDELGPVHRVGTRATVATALRRALDGLQWDVAALEQLPGSVGWPALLDERVWRHEANPVLRLRGGWDAFLAGRSANFRQQLRRRERAVANAGGRFRTADANTLERDIDSLFRLHRARWDGHASDFADLQFHRDVARRALAAGWLRLWLVEVHGRTVAAWHGFQVGSVATYYQAGRDPTLEREGVGTVLLAHTIREAFAEGATEYRFGRGAEPFKYRFTPDDPGLETVVLTRGRRGTLALAGARGTRRLRDAWRAGTTRR
jgi:CelD/BcsL family acetyltransferase involved in cellulose biosynthesis